MNDKNPEDRMWEALHETSDQFWSGQKGWNELSEVERVLLSAHDFDAKVLNAGFLGLVIDRAHEWKEILDLLRTIDADRIADLFNRAILAVYPDGNPPSDPVWDSDALEQRYDDVNEAAVELLDQLSNEYYELPARNPDECIYACMANYFSHHAH